MCFGGVAADVAMASLRSSSCSLHAFAEASSVARSCADSRLIVSTVGVVELEMACPCRGGGGGCCGRGGADGWCGSGVGCGGGGGGVGIGELVLAFVDVEDVVVGEVIVLVVPIGGGVLWWVLALLLPCMWLLWSALSCCRGVGLLSRFGGRVFPCGFLLCGFLRENW